jgi:hypothetical protein
MTKPARRCSTEGCPRKLAAGNRVGLCKDCQKDEEATIRRRAERGLRPTMPAWVDDWCKRFDERLEGYR